MALPCSTIGACLAVISACVATVPYINPSAPNNNIGYTVFMSFELTNRPWKVQLNDHKSDGYVLIVQGIKQALKAYDPGCSDVRMSAKVLELSPLDGDRILVKIMLQFPGESMLEERLFLFWGWMTRDAKSSNAIGDTPGVDPESLVIHSTEKKLSTTGEWLKCSEEGKFICKGSVQRFTVVLKNILWDDKFMDPDSEEFKQLADQMREAINELLKEFNSFADSKVTSLTPGTEGLTAKFEILLVPPRGANCMGALANQACLLKLSMTVEETGHLGSIATGSFTVAHSGKDETFTVNRKKWAWHPYCRREDSVHADTGYNC